MNAITSGLGADVQNRVTNAGRFTKEDLVLFYQAEREGIYQRVQGICIVKCDFTPHGSDTEGIAIVRYPADHPGKQ
jgi:hypothetical protein